MIPARSFLDPARERGYDFYTGVPCSFLTPIINAVIGDPSVRYVGAASEGEAVAIAAGAWLAGRRPVAMCQNSGLGNMVNPLTSLNHPFHIPLLLVTTWRAEPGLLDEPQHSVMGRITPDLLDLMDVPHRLFPKDEEDVSEALDWSDARERETSLPHALIMQKGAVRDDGLDQRPTPRRPAGERWEFASGARRCSRRAMLERFLAEADDSWAVVATTGKTGRELFTLEDRKQHLYQVGSMGGASAMGLGLALNTARRVVVLDGDGAALMKMGNLATIGAERPANLLHIVLDNGVHDSTGGQATVADHVDFPAVALACGYASAGSVDDPDGMARALARSAGRDGPHLIHAAITPGSMEGLGRPTVTPREVARRFRGFILG